MRNFFSPLKACDPYLRFVFMTGITKFSQMSIFSELNNITNLSMVPKYAGICGITKEEIEQQMSESVDEMACKLKLSHEEMLEALRINYDLYIEGKKELRELNSEALCGFEVAYPEESYSSSCMKF